MMGLVRRASHLFNLVMGKVVGSNGYGVACRHKFTAYTIFSGAPTIFCTPNIADNRNVLILLCQEMGAESGLRCRSGHTVDLWRIASSCCQWSCWSMCCRGTASTFVRASHFGCIAWLCGAARGHCCGATCLDEWWCGCVFDISEVFWGAWLCCKAARGELEASGRGALHGHWEIWGVSMTMQDAMQEFADRDRSANSCMASCIVMLTPQISQCPCNAPRPVPWSMLSVSGSTFFSVRITAVLNTCRKFLVRQKPGDLWLILTQDMLHRCRMDDGDENVEGYVNSTGRLLQSA